MAYRSQLKAGRAALHRRLAAAIAERDPASAEENAALIAEHLEAAGDLQAAFEWHMRAATWLTRRDMRAARTSWQRARHVADQLPGDAAGRTAMRISPRSLLCVSAWRVGCGVDDTGFDELRELATAAGDKASLAIGMAGQVFALAAYGRYREACKMVPELLNLGDSVGNPTLTAALLMAALTARFGTGELTEVMRLVAADHRRHRRGSTDRQFPGRFTADGRADAAGRRRDVQRHPGVAGRGGQGGSDVCRARARHSGGTDALRLRDRRRQRAASSRRGDAARVGRGPSRSRGARRRVRAGLGQVPARTHPGATRWLAAR